VDFPRIALPAMLGIMDPKERAGQSALSYIQDGMIVGLGTGSTAAYFIKLLAERVKNGLKIRGIPTSERSRQLALSLGIPLTTLDEYQEIAVTVDGADEVDPQLRLIKGGGGAMLREKIVASASMKLVIIVHSEKLVSRLGTTSPVPVEVVPFGWQVTMGRLSSLGAQPALRQNSDGRPFHSDSGNYIVDCKFEHGISGAWLARRIDHVVGVVEHGLFIGLTSEVHVAGTGEVRILR